MVLLYKLGIPYSYIQKCSYAIGTIVEYSPDTSVSVALVGIPLVSVDPDKEKSMHLLYINSTLFFATSGCCGDCSVIGISTGSGGSASCYGRIVACTCVIYR